MSEEKKDMFLTRTFERILKRLSRSKQPHLRDECRITLDLLKQLHTKRTEKGVPLSPNELSTVSNVSVQALRLACETHHPQLMLLSIQCLQKMMAYGYLRYEIMDLSHHLTQKTKIAQKEKQAKEKKEKNEGENQEEGEKKKKESIEKNGVLVEVKKRKKRRLIESVIEIVSSCYDFPDESVQLQVLKALMTSITTPSCGVHSDTLMVVIRTSYNMYLMTRNVDIQAASKVTLTQILGIIFGRMESVCSIVVEEARERQEKKGEVDEDRENKDEGYVEEFRPRMLAKALVASVFQSLGLHVYSRRNELEEKDGRPEDLLRPDSDLLRPSSPLRLVSSPLRSPASPTPPLSPSSPLPPGKQESEDQKSGSEINSSSQNRQNGAEEKGLEVGSELLITTSPELPENSDPNVISHDCLLIFRALCKLSIKEAGDKKRRYLSSEELAKIQKANSLDLRSKILALQLLLIILQTAGPVAQSHEGFINSCLKRQLCVGVLSINGVSSVPHVFRLSLTIFTTLISTNFKNHLKTEIGIFFEKIFLRIIESHHSSIGQKRAVLEVLHRVCRNPQTLVDIFLNYDCDEYEPRDVFERMVNDLSAIAKGRGFEEGPTESGHIESIRKLGLECLVTIMKSLVGWSKELYENDEGELYERGERGEEGKTNKPLPHSVGSVETPQRKSDHDTSRFERQMMYNQQIKKGKQRFNLKPKDGIKYLVGIGYIQETPQQIATLLRKSDGLDKQQIGEYLGGKDDLNRKVLYEYVDLHFDFKNLEFDLAIRRFLSQFMLPKEAQQIDRIMEKFAQRYYNDNNTSVFANADSAYILAYATIMLATDLHNPAIAKKITLEQWANTLRGMNDEKDFPIDFLSAIYDRIEASPLKLGMDGSSGSSLPDSDGSLLTPAQRQMLFHQETTFMTNKSREILREKLRSKNVFFKSTNIRHVRPMFSIAWCPMLAAFSYMLEFTDDPTATSLCFEGFEYAIRVSSIFYMETEQKAFTKSLTNFTLLDNHIRSIKPKNIQAIQTLLSLSRTDGTYLQDSWIEVLLCVSRLEKIFLVATGLPQPLGHMTPPKEMAKRAKSVSDDPPESLSGKGEPKKENFEEANARAIIRKIHGSDVDAVFQQAKALSGNAIVDFVRSLCKVSLENEIKADPARTYSLQKLVEVAYENMTRIRLVWNRIWFHIGNHLTHVGCSSDKKLAMYAVDSLRQLAMKFLEKDELSNYNFQKSFLKPFGEILSKHRKVLRPLARSLQIRELVMHCLSQMIRSRARNIQSGWKSILSALKSAASDSSSSISSLAFELVEMITTKHFSLVAGLFFVDLVECLGAHARHNTVPEMAIRSIKLVTVCGEKLAKGEVVRVEAKIEGNQMDGEGGLETPADSPHPSPASSPLSLRNSMETILFTDQNEAHLKLWFPVFLSLSRVVVHSSLNIRAVAVKQLFSVLRTYGHMFNENMWKMIFRGVLLPIFDNVQYITSVEGKEKSEDKEWLTSTCLSALSHVMSLFSHFFVIVSHLLHDCLILLVRCILQNNEELANMGSTALFTLVAENKQKWTSEMWEEILTAFGFILIQSYLGDRIYLGLDDLPVQRNQEIEIGSPNRTPSMTPPVPRRNQMRSRSLSFGDATASPLKEKETPDVFDFCPLQTPRRDHELDKSQILVILLGRTRVRLGFLKGMREMVDTNYNSFSAKHLSKILDAGDRSLCILRDANADSSLWKPFLDCSDMWNSMINEEKTLLTSNINLMFRMYREPATSIRSSCAPLIERRFIDFCMKEMIDYGELFSFEDEAERLERHEQETAYLVSKTKSIVLILNSLFALSEGQFMKYIETLYPVFCDLLLSNSRLIRVELRKLFLRIGLRSGEVPS